jgi:hypothetical protein
VLPCRRAVERRDKPTNLVAEGEERLLLELTKLELQLAQGHGRTLAVEVELAVEVLVEPEVQG